MGPEAFATLATWCQAAHQFLSFPFVLGLILMLVLWAGQNLPTKPDMIWLRAGGPMAKGNPPAGKFNAGQKLLYWFVLCCGAALAVSGYLLMFPFALTDIAGQQWAHMVHGILAMIMIAVILGHIYIGTLGMEGAFEAMARGRVDYNWAKEHHQLWLEEELAQAHRTLEPPRRSHPAGAD
jgi:formate dehydrogenase subunit gamma